MYTWTWTLAEYQSFIHGWGNCDTNQHYSLCFMVVSVTPAQYFRAKRGIANGIVYAAGGLGGAVISFVMNALLERVGVQWTFRIIGFATWATGLPAAYLIKQRVPIPPSAVVDWYVLLLHFPGYLHCFRFAILSLLIPALMTSTGVYSATSASSSSSQWAQLPHSPS